MQTRFFRADFSQRTKPMHRRGFALVTTIAIMSLLVLLALSMLALNSTTTRSLRQEEAYAQAKSNARLALTLALGKLQETAGPDQRVTAEASILEDPTQPQAIANAHWVGVWRTDGLIDAPIPSTKGLLYRQTDTGPSEGSLVDQRADGTYNKKEQVLSWLVSQPSHTSIDPETSLIESQRNVVKLVGSQEKQRKAASVYSASDEVLAPRIPIHNNKHKEKGGYAWWIGDEGVKARFDLVAPTEGIAYKNPSLLPAQNGIQSLEGYKGYKKVASNTFDKILSRYTPELFKQFSEDGSLASLQKARQRYFHTLSFHSKGLLVDSLRGGLRKDLSAFLRSSSGKTSDLGSYKGINKATPIIGANEEIEQLSTLSPKFGLIYNWNTLGKNRSLSSALSVQAPQSTAKGMRWSFSSENTPGKSAIDIAQQDTLPLHPIMVEAGISYGVSYTKRKATMGEGWTRLRLNLHYFPRIVLYNPYNVKIKSAAYAVQVFMPHKFGVKIFPEDMKDPKGGRAPYENPIRFFTSNSKGEDFYVGCNYPHRPFFTIPATEFEPGECLVFTADATGYKNSCRYWGSEYTTAAKRLNSFPLTCKATPPLNGNFYFWSDQVSKEFEVENKYLEDGTIKYQIVSLSAGHSSTGNGWSHYIYRLYLNKQPSATVDQIPTDPSGFPPLQTIMQTEDGGLASDAPWMVGIPETTSLPLNNIKDSVVEPFYRFRWGHRIQWLEETPSNQGTRVGAYAPPFTQYNTIANHNLRAGWHVRSPIEVAFRASASGGRYTHGILIDDPYGWEWGDYPPVPTKGENRVSPFGAPASFGGATFPLLDLPSANAPFLSLGMLQHVPFSQFPWHPTYIFGNSLADPRVPRNQTLNYVSPTNWDSIGMHKHDWESIRQSIRGNAMDAKLNHSAFLNDISYELNYALWDSFFLSTIDDSNATQNINNPRIAINANASNTELSDYHKAAKNLSILGAFNVNSTNKNAWKALLSSFNQEGGVPIIGMDGTFKKNNFFSRFLSPYKHGENETSETAETFWKGSRTLNDQEIDSLAEQIVQEVKRRGPFLSLSDFVNRRLVTPPRGNETEFSQTGLKGALQAAIDQTSINKDLLQNYVIEKKEYVSGGPEDKQKDYGSTYPHLSFNGNTGKFGPKPDHHHWADSKLVGTPSFLTQADILQKIGSILAARSDTFVIRCYGDSVDSKGKILARAWCEAIVQRTTQPIEADDEGLNPHQEIATHPKAALGRKFKILSVRWLNPDEV